MQHLTYRQLADAAACSARSLERLKADGTLPVASYSGKQPLFDGPTCLAILRDRAQKDDKRRSQHYLADETFEPITRETTKLIRQRANQQRLKCSKLHSKLSPGDFVRDYIAHIAEALPAALDAWIDDLAPRIIGLPEIHEVGMELRDSAERALAALEVACDNDSFWERHPEVEEPDDSPYCKLTWTDTSDAKSDLELARLEKIRALSETERLRTCLMDGTYFNSADVERYLCQCVSVIRNKMYAAPSRFASILKGMTDAEEIKEHLRAYKAELLEELPKFDPQNFEAVEFIAVEESGAEFIEPDDVDDPENEQPEPDDE
jgi:phage terminase Nu1 subunit (DNA packaging protein)